jgi:hypothetical protein
MTQRRHLPTGRPRALQFPVRNAAARERARCTRALVTNEASSGS